MSGIQSNNIQLASNTPLSVQSNKGSNAVETYIDETQSSTTLVVLNTDRKKVIIINESKKSLYLRYQSPAIDKEGIELNSGDYWIETEYIGNIYGIWSNGADKGARIIEIS